MGKRQMFHREQTTEVPLCTFLAGVEGRGHCVAGGSQGPECGVSSSVALPALCMAKQQVGLWVSCPTAHACHGHGSRYVPASLRHWKSAIWLWGEMLDDGMSCKRSFNFLYLCNRLLRLLCLGGDRVDLQGCKYKWLEILSRCSASWKYPCDSLAFHLHLPPLHAAHIVFLLLIVLDSDNASPLASGRHTGWITKTL